uniref:Uncharacterized protein n=1 Tax=Timema cristinae TaxID=61476 RepID=A0A7R9H8E6_TIMCR|nr:unnamed protein product [Timema cristinae]
MMHSHQPLYPLCPVVCPQEPVDCVYMFNDAQPSTLISFVSRRVSPGACRLCLHVQRCTAISPYIPCVPSCVPRSLWTVYTCSVMHVINPYIPCVPSCVPRSLWTVFTCSMMHSHQPLYPLCPVVCPQEHVDCVYMFSDAQPSTLISLVSRLMHVISPYIPCVPSCVPRSLWTVYTCSVMHVISPLYPLCPVVCPQEPVDCVYMFSDACYQPLYPLCPIMCPQEHVDCVYMFSDACYQPLYPLCPAVCPQEPVDCVYMFSDACYQPLYPLCPVVCPQESVDCVYMFSDACYQPLYPLCPAVCPQEPVDEVTEMLDRKKKEGLAYKRSFFVRMVSDPKIYNPKIAKSLASSHHRPMERDTGAPASNGVTIQTPM